ncbi:MAG: sugar-binding domain-containing protein [Chitinophagaceae bacterium]
MRIKKAKPLFAPFRKTSLLIISFLLFTYASAQPRTIQSFNEGWKFFLGDDSTARQSVYNDKSWRTLTLPHDWSIEGNFSESHPATNQGGALPTGVGWYRKTFTIPSSSKNKLVYIEFDGVYCNSEVWINEHYLGKRPNGYISFRYELTPYLKYGSSRNVISVKVDNSAQPASRWYTGSGIYRNVWLTTTGKRAIDHWGIFVTTPNINADSATVQITSKVLEKEVPHTGAGIRHEIYDAAGKKLSTSLYKSSSGPGAAISTATIKNPVLWSTDSPYLYTLVSRIYELKSDRILDEVRTSFGIRSFHFDSHAGFFLNGKPLKILGVCNHHDLGALGAAVNTRAMERQLEILKAMGCNAIRTAHNPPAPELLDLCDRMGFLVMDEAFDMWKKRKNRQDYHKDFEKWSKADLEDMVKRDRNHPSIFIWSIGNEIREQFDSTGITITRELAAIIKALDTTRSVTSALTENFPEKNFIYRSGALDVLGFNYKLEAYGELPKRFPGQKFIATETSSALATRGHYDMPSDSHRLWPPDSKTPFIGNRDHTVSAYDHVYAYWGSTHEDGWKAVKKYDHMAGIFVWSGFDFLGEPVPYPWPARSSYYGMIDLAGFPKDAYYMYQSEWTNKPVLHIFPHWNWPAGKVVDVWAYYSQADEVELFLNERSLGVRKKQGDSLHVMWPVPFTPGTLKAVSRRGGNIVLTKEIKTAGAAARIVLQPDRISIKADGKDLSFIKVTITDAAGNPVPDAENLVKFTIRGSGFIAGVDNGNPVSMEPFKADQRKAFNSACLVMVGALKGAKESIFIEANSPGLTSAIVPVKIIF